MTNANASAVRTRTLVECGMLIAVATVLGYIPIYSLPMGGSITLCATAPLVILSYRQGWKWGLFAATVHGVIQLMLGFSNVMYCPTLLTMIGCALLDYILAYAVVGLSSKFTFGIEKNTVAVIAGTLATGLLRYLCSFVSGVLIWGGYAPEGMPVWQYSLLYNGSFMLPEIILTTIAVAAIMQMLNGKKTEK